MSTTSESHEKSSLSPVSLKLNAERVDPHDIERYRRDEQETLDAVPNARGRGSSERYSKSSHQICGKPNSKLRSMK